MKLDRRVLLAVAMVVSGIVAAGCKSSGDQPDNADPQPGVQAPSNTAAPSNGDQDGRRARRHHGHGRGHGRWMRRAQMQDSGTAGGGDDPR